MNPDGNSFPAPPSLSPTPPERPEPEKITAQHNPYEFIVNPALRPKKRGFNPGGNAFAMKLVVLVGGAVVVMVFGAFILNIAFGKKVNPAALLPLAQTQTELARVADEGSTANAATVRNAAVNTSLVMTSQQQMLTAYMLKQGYKTISKTLALKKSADTDSQLTAAAAANTFDVTFTQLMVGQLQTYAASLKTTYNGATGKKERAILSADYTQVQILLSQWPTPSSLASD
ncbi:MAG TPA: hypothetical protein VLF91_01545 [Candidatus Saccharimonadales bacterium]|nr:hypothetical protein [Candidatus Saccharimonadales bacterium]